MLFEKNPPLNLLICDQCKATGSFGWERCPRCKSLGIGTLVRGRWLYWRYPLTRYHLALEKARRRLEKIRAVTILLFCLNAWFWTGWFIVNRELYTYFKEGLVGIRLFYSSISGAILILFALGAWALLYFWYRAIVSRTKQEVVERYDYHQKIQSEEEKKQFFTTWSEVFQQVKKYRRLNIADTFTTEAKIILGEAYRMADKEGFGTVTPVHLFFVLLDSNRIGNLFLRLGLPGSEIKKRLQPLLSKENTVEPKKDAVTMPLVNRDFHEVLFWAYEEAYGAHQEYVSVTELMLATVKQMPAIQDVLYDLNIDKQKLINVAEWVRIRERLHRQYIKFRVAAGRRSTKGMDKAMTAVQTPYLNQFSEDVTLLAQFGHLDSCIAREKEMEEIFRVVEGGGKNVMLVGDYGVGKRSVIEGIAQKMVEDDVPGRLQDKRLVKLSVSALLAGTTPSGAVERLRNIMYEISRAGNIILFIHNIHELIGVSAGAGGDNNSSLDVSDTLAEFLTKGRFFTFATTTVDDFSRHIINSPLGNVFAKVEIKEMNENQAIQVLESKVGGVEYKQSVFFSYDAIAKAVKLCSRFIHEMYLPGSALEIMNEAAVYAHSKKGDNTLVTEEEVAAVVAKKTGIPVNTVSVDETSKLMHLEEEMHKRVIGQEEAVGLVANALRRARAEIRSISRPIANFLFLGPTGVGKTELAKTIAVDYFGGEERMIRLDMSEYQDKSSIYRLIGAPGEKGSGILTEAVRRNPFALLLLDEMEKADKDVLNLFLQVMDDGRLTDSTGRVSDFTNVILIATSNAATSYVQEQMRAGISSDAIKERLLHGELKQYFRPEFLNRFDGIVLFKPLNREDIKKIAALMLKRLGKDLEAKGIDLQIEPAAVEFLADVGFDPEFGARPMRRAIQERLENKIAELLLSGKLKRRDKVVIQEGGEITIR